jgi:4-amino-4-deoxy-L-arabinose transferase-like glycosyltransferase
VIHSFENHQGRHADKAIEGALYSGTIPDFKPAGYLARFTLAACIIFVVFLQFHKLGQLAIVQWDESRLAVNAAEMSQSGDLLVTTFNHLPDISNTKPPLMIWLQVASIHLFGLNEFAIRFPSALAGCVCIMFCGYIVFKYKNNLYFSCFSMILLACSNGFIQLHGSLTGDYDALLALWLLVAFHHFYNGFIRSSRTSKVWFLLFLSLAIMTKSAAAIIALPAFIVAAYMSKGLRTAALSLCFCLFSIIPFILYVMLREWAAAGYLSAIKRNDFGGRFSNALEDHISEWHYYIVNLFDYRFNLFIWLLPIALIFALFKKDGLYRYYSLVFCSYLFFISLAKTRIHWYDTPILPVAAIVITFFIIHLYNKIPNQRIKIVFVSVMTLLLLIPAREKYQFIAERKGLILSMDYYELSDLLRTHQGKDQLFYLSNNYDPEFYFYTLKNEHIRRGKLKQLKKGDLVAIGNQLTDSLDVYYYFETVDSTLNAKKVRINGIKESLSKP